MFVGWEASILGRHLCFASIASELYISGLLPVDNLILAYALLPASAKRGMPVPQHPKTDLLTPFLRGIRGFVCVHISQYIGSSGMTTSKVAEVSFNPGFQPHSNTMGPQLYCFPLGLIPFLFLPTQAMIRRKLSNIQSISCAKSAVP